MLEAIGKLLNPGRPIIEQYLNSGNVNKDSKIEMLEYDLVAFGSKWRTAEWEDMVRQWLRKGAQVDVYAQKVHRTSEEAIRRLLRNNKGFRLYEFSPNNTYLTEYHRTRHFLVCNNPPFLWIETEHNPGSPRMHNILSILEADKDYRFEAFKKRLEQIKSCSTEFTKYTQTRHIQPENGLELIANTISL